MKSLILVLAIVMALMAFTAATALADPPATQGLAGVIDHICEAHNPGFGICTG